MPNRIIRTKIKGLENVGMAFDSQPDKVRLGVIDGLEIILRLVTNRAQKKILTRGSGRKYGRHQASAPGEAPATDTGTLVNSAETEIQKDNKNQIFGILSFIALYARWLEFGTRFMAARPFLLPSLDEIKAKIPAIFINSIRARLKK